MKQSVSRIGAVLVIVILVVIAFFGVYVGISMYTYKGLSGTNSNVSISYTCIIPDSGDLFLTLQNSSSGMPLTSVPIQVSFLAPVCPPNPHATATIGQIMTNQSGIAFIEGEVGEYYFSLTYSGINYNVNASVGPEAATCVTLGIPSGKVNITNSPPMQNVC